jgi:hypothetical protein
MYEERLTEHNQKRRQKQTTIQRALEISSDVLQKHIEKMRSSAPVPTVIFIYRSWIFLNRNKIAYIHHTRITV